MIKAMVLGIFACCLVAGNAVAAVKSPAKVEKAEKSAKKAAKTAAPQVAPAAEPIDAKLAELNALINDASLKPKNGKQAMLEDFQEDLELTQKSATVTTDDLANKGGMQELSSETLSAPPESEQQ